MQTINLITPIHFPNFPVTNTSYAKDNFTAQLRTPAASSSSLWIIPRTATSSSVAENSVQQQCLSVNTYNRCTYITYKSLGATIDLSVARLQPYM